MRSREATLRLAIRYTAMSRASSSVRMVLAAAPSRPVAGHHELVLDEVADEHTFGPAEDFRDIERPERRQENEHRARDDARARVSGNVTCQNDWKPLAPRSRAASSRRLSSFSMDAYSGKTMNGRNVYRMPMNTAKSPYMKDTAVP